MSATANQDAAGELAYKAYEYGKRVSMNANQQDKELWALVSDVPYVDQPYPYMCAIFNIIIPGLGTILCTCLEPDSPSWSKTQLFIGFLQMLTCIVIVGWIWSLYWGYLIVMKAHAGKP